MLNNLLQVSSNSIVPYYCAQKNNTENNGYEEIQLFIIFEHTLIVTKIFQKDKQLFFLLKLKVFLFHLGIDIVIA